MQRALVSVITYSRNALFKLRKQGILDVAVPNCKQANIFRFRGKRAGVKHRKESIRVSSSAPTSAAAAHLPKPTTNQDKLIKFCLLNARSLLPKADELALHLRTERITFAAITETWLKPSTPDSAVCPPSYNIMRSDRGNKKGGGTCILADSDWKVTTLDCLQDHPLFMECTAIHPRLPRMPRDVLGIVVHTVYIPPSITRAEMDAAMDHIVLSHNSFVCKYPFAKILIMGDFNNCANDPAAKRLGLTQIVKSPTRGKKILDLIYTDWKDLSAVVVAPLANSDHSIVQAQALLAGMATDRNTAPSFIWIRPKPQSAIDACGLYLANYSWSSLMQATDLNRKVELFYDCMFSVWETYFPAKRIRIFPGSKPWFSEDIDRLMWLRNTAFRQDKRDYKRLRTEVQEAICKAKRNYYDKKIANLRTTDPRRWHKQVQSFCGMTKPRQEARPPGTAQELNEFFSKLGTEGGVHPGGSHPPMSNVTQSAGPHDLLRLEEHEVFRMLFRINHRKAQPVYDVPAFLLKQFAAELAKPVASIFNDSLTQGTIPKAWNTVEISPIPKVRNPTSPDHYRPIAKLAVMLKVLEKFVADVIRLAISKSLDPRQFGGCKGLSCSHYLISFLQRIIDLTSSGQYVCAQALDVQKAFNAVEHMKLKAKVSALRLQEQIERWTFQFVVGLFQVVCFRGTLELSEPLPITRGVPQGASMAPTLFVVYVNDMPENPDQWQFYDDISTLGAGQTASAAVVQAQSRLCDLQGWFTSNGLRVNPTKCKSILFKPFPRAVENLAVWVQWEGLDIPRVDSLRILGVIFQSDLKWNEFVQHLVSRAKSKLFFLRLLSKSGINSTHLRHVFLAYVRPHLEYSCAVWSSRISMAQHRQLDGLQKAAVSLISRLWSASYEENLDTLNLQPLADRWDNLTIKIAIFMFRHNTFRCLFPPLQASISGRSTRSAGLIAIPAARTENLRRSPIHNMSRLLNTHILNIV